MVLKSFSKRIEKAVPWNDVVTTYEAFFTYAKNCSGDASLIMFESVKDSKYDDILTKLNPFSLAI